MQETMRKEQRSAVSNWQGSDVLEAFFMASERLIERRDIFIIAIVVSSIDSGISIDWKTIQTRALRRRVRETDPNARIFREVVVGIK